MLDFQSINSATLGVLRVLLPQWIPGGIFRGNEYVVANPTRDDKTPGSFQINAATGIWKDFASGDGGKDPISLFAFINKLSQGDACKQLAAVVGIESAPRSRDDYSEQVIPAPVDAPALPTYVNRKSASGKWERHPITHSWAYRSVAGDILFHTVRYSTETGKDVVPFCVFRAPDGAMKWRPKSHPDPRPLYNLNILAHAPEAQIAIFEGEKKAQALQGLVEGAGLMQSLVATTWQGGARAPQKTDWTPCRGRRCILWPDNDDPGIVAMHDVATILSKLNCDIRQIENPPDKPAGWDIADAILVEGWDLPRIFGWMRDHSSDARVRPQSVPPAPEPSKPPAQEPCGPLVFQYQGKIDLNQSAVSYRYVQESGIIHDPAVSRFYIYYSETGLWGHQSDNVTVRDLGALVQCISREINWPELLKKRTAGLLHGLMLLSRGFAECPYAFSTRPTAIHVRNGMLSVVNGAVTMNPFSRNYYSRNRSEYEYMPAAECPRFLSELLLPAIPAEDISLIQRYVGQCLLGDNPSQTFLILRGTPGGGKGTLTNIIESIIGRHNTTEIRVEQLTERFELYRYLDKTLLCGKDVRGDFLNVGPAHVLKALVGGDQLTGEAKHGNETFQVIGRFNCIICTNTRLRIRLDSDLGAWRRRMLIVDYERPAPEKPIAHFDEELLTEEGPGILRWAIDGAVMLLDELQKYGRIQLTIAQQGRIDDLLYESDSVQSFVRDIVIEDRGSDISIQEISVAYRDYCDARGWEPLRERALQSELPEAMLGQRRAHRRNDIHRDGKACRGYSGFGVRGKDGCVVGGWD
jgi:P4 family phage/plasmid primase-like protien